MANEQNLIPQAHVLSVEEQSKGGKASGEARRRRKTLKEELLALLSDDDIQERMSLALINEAIEGNNAGSVTRAFEVVRDTIGEKPVDKVEQVNIDMEYKSSVDYIQKLLNDR